MTPLLWIRERRWRRWIRHPWPLPENDPALVSGCVYCRPEHCHHYPNQRNLDRAHRAIGGCPLPNGNETSMTSPHRSDQALRFTFPERWRPIDGMKDPAALAADPDGPTRYARWQFNEIKAGIDGTPALTYDGARLDEDTPETGPQHVWRTGVHWWNVHDQFQPVLATAARVHAATKPGTGHYPGQQQTPLITADDDGNVTAIVMPFYVARVCVYGIEREIAFPDDSDDE